MRALGVDSLINPFLKTFGFLTTNHDPFFVFGPGFHDQFAIEPVFDFMYGFNVHDVLPVNSEEFYGVELFVKLVKRKINDVMVTVKSEGGGYLIGAYKPGHFFDV